MNSIKKVVIPLSQYNLLTTLIDLARFSVASLPPSSPSCLYHDLCSCEVLIDTYFEPDYESSK